MGKIVEARRDEADALVETMEKRVECARSEFGKVTADVDEAIASEKAIAEKVKLTQAKKQPLKDKTHETKRRLIEMQKRLTALEVHEMTHHKMKALQEARAAANKLAEDAKKAMMEQRQKEKEAMEETKRR